MKKKKRVVPYSDEHLEILRKRFEEAFPYKKRKRVTLKNPEKPYGMYNEKGERVPVMKDGKRNPEHSRLSNQRQAVKRKIKKFREGVSTLRKEMSFAETMLRRVKKKIITQEKRNQRRLLAIKKGTFRSWWCDVNGLKCQGTWERDFASMCINAGFKIKRCNKTFNYRYEGIDYEYTPDFIVEYADKQFIVEIKGARSIDRLPYTNKTTLGKTLEKYKETKSFINWLFRPELEKLGMFSRTYKNDNFIAGIKSLQSIDITSSKTENTKSCSV